MNNFWLNKRVLITGHTGFKGAWLAHWLLELGAEVHGLALPPNYDQSLYNTLRLSDRLSSDVFCDIRVQQETKKGILQADPEILFHFAAQPLVQYAFRAPIETFSVNVMGTVHVMDSVLQSEACKMVVAATTDKVYENKEWSWPYREVDQLGGHEPYGCSKAACEMVLKAYRSSYFSAKSIGLSVVRAGNVFGGGDWSEARLVPDLIRAFTNNDEIVLRNPNATRPWQHVLEALSGYIQIAEKGWHDHDSVNCEFNIGPDIDGNRSVADLVNIAIKLWGSDTKTVIKKNSIIKESKFLSLDNNLAKSSIGWRPFLKFHEALEKTISWYRAQYEKKDMIDFSTQQLLAFQNLLSKE